MSSVFIDPYALGGSVFIAVPRATDVATVCTHEETPEEVVSVLMSAMMRDRGVQDDIPFVAISDSVGIYDSRHDGIIQNDDNKHRQ